MSRGKPNQSFQQDLGIRERELFDRAFALAHFIHVNKEIAFFVAEDALEELSTIIGYQNKNRKPAQGLRGFWKWGERARPIRRTLFLSELQMLQWLVYRHSQRWERITERSEGLYTPNDDDLIVRYLEFLVFSTVRRNSFYVTLALASLLHQFSRREIRLFYDILTQNDSARMKDTNYIGKQRLQLLDRVSQRFDGYLEVVNTPGGEKQFVTRPTTDSILRLVRETLRRLTPWDSDCPIKPGFDVTDIPELYFPGTELQDEDAIERNRIHTVLDPECFDEFSKGLSNYVRSLPITDLDNTCNFTLPAQRLTIPRFTKLTNRPPRGNRLQTPELSMEDYIRLQRTLETRANRKRNFVPDQLVVSIDGEPAYSFQPDKPDVRRIDVFATSVIEVWGRDSIGDVLLVIIALGTFDISGPGFVDSIVAPSGDRIMLKINRLGSVLRRISPLQIEIEYQFEPLRTLEKAKQLLRKGREAGHPLKASFRANWRVASLAAVTVMFVASLVLWWQFRPEPQIPEVRQTRVPVELPKPASENISTGRDKAPSRGAPKADVVILNWRTDRAAAVNALNIETTRSEKQILHSSGRMTKITLSFPAYNYNGNRYASYRLTLSASTVRIWRHRVRAPKLDLDPDRDTHNLDLVLSTKRLRSNADYNLRIEGKTHNNWQIIGDVIFNTKD